MLSEEDVEKIYLLSKEKYISVIKLSQNIYESFLNRLGLEKERNFLDKVETKILSTIEREKNDVFNRRLWEDGWMRIDPYFLVCFKPIFPLVYVKFYKKGTNTTQIKRSFSASAINDGFRKIDGKSLNLFLKIVSDEGTKYYIRLEKILKQFRRRPKEVNLKGIPKGVVYDVLRYMRKTK